MKPSLSIGDWWPCLLFYSQGANHCRRIAESRHLLFSHWLLNPRWTLVMPLNRIAFFTCIRLIWIIIKLDYQYIMPISHDYHSSRKIHNWSWLLRYFFQRVLLLFVSTLINWWLCLSDKTPNLDTLPSHEILTDTCFRNSDFAHSEHIIGSIFDLNIHQFYQFYIIKISLAFTICRT